MAIDFVNSARTADGAITPIEEVSRQVLEVADGYEERLRPYYEEIARCSDEIPEELRDASLVEIESLRRTSSNLRAAQQRVSSMADEFSARLRDGRQSVNRKWYLPNPPANAAIDMQERERNHFARGLNLYKVLLILFIGSFAGVVVELIWCYMRNGYLESRSGLVYGPFNVLYGVGTVALSLALYRYRNRGMWLSFLGGMIIGSLVEYGCSWFQEVAFGSRSWDYSDMPFNLNGRICLMYSVFWGILGVIWIKDIYPRMAKWILKLPNHAGKILTLVLTIFLLLNCLISGAAVLRWSERHEGIPADNCVRQLLDERFPDERLEQVYANMSFD